MKNIPEYIYRLAEERRREPLNDYLCRYKENRDEHELRLFLHFHEPALNRLIRRFEARYSSEGHFEDLKQTYIVALIGLLPEYEPEHEHESFLSVFRYRLNDALHQYARENIGAYCIQTDGHYKMLRRVSFLYFNTPDKSGENLINYVSERTGIRIETVRKLVEEAFDFRYYESVYTDDEDGWFHDWVEDEGFRTGRIVLNGLIMDEMVEAVERLPYKERQIFLGAAGVSCIYCGRICNRTTYAELASRFELSSESAGEKLCKKARLRLLSDLYDKGWLDFIDVKRKKKDKHSIIFSYRPRCDGEEGLIRFPTSENEKAGASIETLADLDTILSHRYALKVIQALSGMNMAFPKSLLLVWWV